MAWTYNGNRIYVQKITRGASAIAPRLQPIGGGSVIQSFGYDSTIRNIEAIVVGDIIASALEALAKDGMQEHPLVSPEGGLGDWMLKDYNQDRTNSTCQTIDTTQPEDSPVYNVTLTLWRED